MGEFNNVLRVVVGVIRDNKHILLSRRLPNKPFAGYWEFPGGKCVDGESESQALQRELHEELGIQLVNSRPLIMLTDMQATPPIQLMVQLVTAYRGEPQGCEGQPVQWVLERHLKNYQLPPLNAAIIKAISLPSVYCILPTSSSKLFDIKKKVRIAMQRGARMVRYRLSANPQSALDNHEVAELLAFCHQYSTQLIVDDLTLLKAVDADGLHITSQQLEKLTERPVPNDKLCIACVHDRVSIAKANRCSVDAMCLSPVQQTQNHPQAVPLGWPTFQHLVQQAQVPCYALGGLSISDVPRAWANGGQGIAAISGLTQ